LTPHLSVALDKVNAGTPAEKGSERSARPRRRVRLQKSRSSKIFPWARNASAVDHGAQRASTPGPGSGCGEGSESPR
jgi:hypothetical protein